MTHRDDYYIFAIISSGEAVGMIDFCEVPIGEREAVIIAPSQVHALKSYNIGTKGWLLALKEELFTIKESDLLAEYAVNSSPFGLDRQRVEDINAVLELCERHADSLAIVRDCMSLVKSLLLDVLPVGARRAGDRHLKITGCLKRLVAKHLATDKRPSAFAAMMNISEVYLNEAVKRTTGLSASRFIRSLIVLEAKRQLAYTLLTPREVATRLGYDDYSYFSRLFKRESSVSPSEFRRNLD